MASYDVASIICQALGRGVTRSKRRALQWLRTAAENGYVEACFELARDMYLDMPYAREIGHVGEAAVAAGPDRGGVTAGVRQAHDIPTDVLTGVIYWFRKGYELGALLIREAELDAPFADNDVAMLRNLDKLRTESLEGAKYCYNGCEVRTAEYCSPRYHHVTNKS